MRTSALTCTTATLFALACLLPSLAVAQFDARKPKDVGTVFLPFTAEKEADDSLAFLLEDLVGAKLLRRVKRPVYVGRDVTVALTGTADSCLRQPECVQLLGGQFNASLAANVEVRRSGSDVELDVDWYMTGHGLKAHEESFSFPVGEEERMLDELARMIEELFESSLKMEPSTLAREGGIISGPEDGDQRIADLERGRKKKVVSRREDFGTPSSNADLEGKRPGDLREIVRGDDEEIAEPAARPATRKSKPSPARSSELEADVSDYEDDPALADTGDGGDLALEGLDSDEELSRDLDLDETEDSGGARQDEPEQISLSSEQTKGDSVANYMEAQRLGIGKREYNRMARSGMPFAEYQARRWAFGKRFHLKVSGFYGMGGLTRRYATIIFVRAGNVKTEEAAWESLGASFVNPGGQIGFGIAPIDEFEIALDVGVMYGRQMLRREYDGQEVGSNAPADPAGVSTAHVVADLKARFFVFPLRKVKFAPHIGATMLFMAGYDIVPEPPLEYSSRPPAVVVGVTAGAGVVISLSPFMGLDIDLSGTVYVSQGAAKFESYDYFNGVVEPYLSPNKVESRAAEVPVMGRLTVGPRFFF